MTAPHPARRISFDALVNGLAEAKAARLVSEAALGNLRIYCYSQSCVFDRQWNEITLLARGLILDVAERRVVATPFPKFFNLGERGDQSIPDLPFETFEKLDGSLIILFHHDGGWHTATKGSLASSQARWAGERLRRPRRGSRSATCFSTAPRSVSGPPASAPGCASRATPLPRIRRNDAADRPGPVS